MITDGIADPAGDVAAAVGRAVDNSLSDPCSIRVHQWLKNFRGRWFVKVAGSFLPDNVAGPAGLGPLVSRFQSVPSRRFRLAKWQAGMESRLFAGYDRE